MCAHTRVQRGADKELEWRPKAGLVLELQAHMSAVSGSE